MRIIVHEMKLRSPDKVVLKSHPTNLYRDDESKTLMSMFIQNCQREYLQDSLKNDTIIDPSVVLGGKEEIIKINKKSNGALKKSSNVLKINQPILEDGDEPAILGDEDDLFLGYPFAFNINTPVLTMQEIFINEKGSESLRALNIRLSHLKKKEPKEPVELESL